MRADNLRYLALIILLFILPLSADDFNPDHYPEPNPPRDPPIDYELQDLAICEFADPRGFFHQESRYEPDFSPSRIDWVGLQLTNKCVFSWHAINVETVGTMGIRLNGVYESASIVDLSTAPFGIAFVGDYSMNSALMSKGVALRGNPYVYIAYDAECDCIRANRPIITE